MNDVQANSYKLHKFNFQKSSKNHIALKISWTIFPAQIIFVLIEISMWNFQATSLIYFFSWFWDFAKIFVEFYSVEFKKRKARKENGLFVA